nr:AAA family ATPase [uncultured Mediterraneibacter sp.]
MAKRVVRIESITIKNFKNVSMGTINFENKRKAYKSSVLGLYGQNGSGKTALINAIQLLKLALCGKQIPNKYADYINVDAESATLEYEFVIHYPQDRYKVWYQFSLKKVIDELASNLEDEVGTNMSTRVEMFDEVLAFAYESKEERLRKAPLIDTRVDGLFSPKAKLAELVGDDKDQYMDLLVTKRLTKTTSRGFIFSRELINQYRKNCENSIYMRLIEGLYFFAHRELFVIDTESIGLISLNELPLVFKYRNDNSEAVGRIMLSLDRPTLIPEESYDLVEMVLKNMNIVLEQIVPGLKIGIVDLGAALTKDGKVAKQIQLMSLKNSKEIPFCYESEGIKKIVSVLQLLIVVYNHPSVTVAIDELDGGVFEYLLGELLNIISEKGKGQLIFTSHNLRPLETIDRGFIAFTTTNPEKRYIRLTNVKGTNNLRDFYYRDIVLGEQSEQVYNPTNNFEIALAFREAGEAFGS